MRPWSYSRLSTYSDCPKQYWYSYVEKMKGFRPDSPAANRGSEIHSKAEDYLLGRLPIYPPELQRVSAHAMLLKSKKALPEQKLAVTSEWTPCEFDSPETYFRAIIDIIYEEDGVVHIQDWKTGQIYASHATQLENYVAVAAAHYPEAKRFQSRAVYIDQGVVSNPKITEPPRVKPIRLLLDGKIKNAEEDTVYPLRAGQHCRWCSYSKKFNGPCPN